jgi:Cu/Ag efflux protein CusF
MLKMKTIRLLMSAALVACAALATAADEALLSVSASRMVEASASVAAIDQGTREVTLTTEGGESITFTAGENVRNLEQVAVGDLVTMTVLEEISMSLVRPEQAMDAAEGGLVAAATAARGERPGMVVADIEVITATVEAIDLDAGTFALKGPEGNVMEFKARSAENLQKANVGDLVVFELDRAISLVVEAPEAP